MRGVGKAPRPDDRLTLSRYRSRRRAVETADLVETGRLVGWREWLSLPGLGIERINAKIDTGAYTSALHAVGVESIDRDGEPWVTFLVRPRAGGARDRTQVRCQALARGVRKVKNSGGSVELRHVVLTPVELAGKRFDIEVTLTDRADMGYEMLFGRTALRRGGFLVHPSRSYVQSRIGSSRRRDVT